MRKELKIRSAVTCRGFGGEFKLDRIVVESKDGCMSISCYGLGKRKTGKPRVIIRCSEAETKRLIRLLQLATRTGDMPIDEQILKAARRIAETVIKQKLNELGPADLPDIEINPEDIRITDDDLKAILDNLGNTTL